MNIELQSVKKEITIQHKAHIEAIVDIMRMIRAEIMPQLVCQIVQVPKHTSIYAGERAYHTTGNLRFGKSNPC